MSPDRPLLYGIPQPPETRGTLANVGLGMFVRASMRCPASVTAQGIHMAIENFSLGYDLGKVRDALVNDQQAIEKAKADAEKAHRKFSANVENDAIDTSVVKDIISNDFYFAIKFGVLTPFQLQRIIIRFDKLRGSMPSEDVEEDVSEFAYGIYYEGMDSFGFRR